MRMTAWVCTVLLLAPPALAARYVLKKVEIPEPEARDIALTVVSGTGDFGGTYLRGASAHGFVVIGGHFVRLPDMREAFPLHQASVPTAITPAGHVAGIYFAGTNGRYFVFANRQVIARGDGGTAPGGALAGLNNAGDFFFSGMAASAASYARVGTPRHLVRFRPALGDIDDVFISGINAEGALSGFAYPRPFLCAGYSCDAIGTSSEAVADMNVVVNDNGLVAGALAATSAPRNVKLFLYHAGVLRRYAFPDRAVAVQVGGIASSGTVAGVTTDGTGRERAFTLKDGALRLFGDWRETSGTDVRAAGVTDAGAVGLVVRKYVHGRTPVTQSYLAVCKGEGC